MQLWEWGHGRKRWGCAGQELVVVRLQGRDESGGVSHGATWGWGQGRGRRVGEGAGSWKWARPSAPPLLSFVKDI